MDIDEDRSLADLMAEIMCDIPQREWDCLPSSLRRRLDNYVYGPNVQVKPHVPRQRERVG